MTTSVLKLLHADAYGNLLRDHTADRLRKLLTTEYVESKIAQILYERRHPDHPWLSADAISLLEGFLKPDFCGFEWGSGRGSLWLAKRSGRLVSVEHHPVWADKVRGWLSEAGVMNVDYRLVPEEEYTETINGFPDGAFDYVLVDGLFRDEALVRSIPKVRPGGWIIFDNVNWYLPSDSKTPHSRSRADGPATPIFREAMEKLAGWPSVWTTNGVNDTALFVRPGGPEPSRPIEVSVVVPTFHREALVLQAVASVLVQEGVSAEVIVVDDSAEGSARAAIEGLGDPRVRYLKRAVPSRGKPALARNDGLRLARGRYVVFLDDDDRLAEGGLSALANALGEAPSKALAVGNVLPFSEELASTKKETAYFERAASLLRRTRTRVGLVSALLYDWAPLIGSACMLRTYAARDAGGLDPSIGHCEDGEMALRVARATGFVYVDQPVVHYRVGKTSRIHGPNVDQRAMREAYRRMHVKYRDMHGLAELLAMKGLARLRQKSRGGRG